MASSVGVASGSSYHGRQKQTTRPDSLDNYWKVKFNAQMMRI